MEPDHHGEELHEELREDSPAASPHAQPAQPGGSGFDETAGENAGYADEPAYDDYSEYDLHDEFAGEYAESIGPRSAAGMSHFSRASTRGDSRLDRDLKDALDMVKVSDHKIGALRKMHAQFLLRKVEDALGDGAIGEEDARQQKMRLLQGGVGDSDDSGSDGGDSSLADSAMVYKAQGQHKYSSSGVDFDRISARMEKEMGLGDDTASLLSLRAGSVASDVERQYIAEPFNGDTLEDGSIFSSDESDDEDQVKWQKLFRRRVTINRAGCTIMAVWVVALIFYLYVRITKTLDLGPYLAYGIFVLIVEIMGATATALYGINLILNPVPPEDYKLHPETPVKAVKGTSAGKGKKRKKKHWWSRKQKGKDGSDSDSEFDAENPEKLSVEQSAESFGTTATGISRTSSGADFRAESESAHTIATTFDGQELENRYHVRVLIPCYKEELFIVQKTLNAIRLAALPAGCQRTVYLLDDGKAKDKRKWAQSLGPDVVYVSGRKRPSDESNGKSGNLNNACSQIYPESCKIPLNEVICIMDADQEADPTFFMKMLPLLDDGDDVAMVLSPQCFHNLHVQADIFNHSNIHFWEYMQIGYDALSFISCSGTNFLIRAQAFQECGWSPTWTLTEDFALGMELKKRNWQCRYMREFLAIGEAPDGVRNCFQQKSRWCKGHFQVLFSNQHCPLFQTNLSWLQRIMYLQGVWSYIVASLCTPTFIAVPIVTIWAGVFPIVLNFWAAVGLTVYYLATCAVLNYVRKMKHLKPLWFSNIANQIMWWTYVKAFWRGLVAAFGTKITFKTTLKGTGRLAGTAFGDLWVPFLVFIALVASFGMGVHKLVTSASAENTLMISLVWVVYNLIPPYLLLHYHFIGRGKSLAIMAQLAIYVTTLLSLAALILIWFFYPTAYNYGQALGDTHFFYNTQRVGKLPDRSVSWRGDALLQEYAINYNSKTFDFGGGFMTGREVGTVKMTMPLAWSTTMVAWGMLDFKDGYTSAGETQAGERFLQWSVQYLLKTIVGTQAKPLDIKLIWQVGNTTEDSLAWSRPEDITAPRPFYYVPVALGTSDLLGQLVGALASTALVFKETTPTTYDTLMSWALPLYGVAIGQYQGYYLDYLSKPACVTAPQRTSLVVPNCDPPYFPLNGSSANTYNSTSYNDDLSWAAMWMYRATGDGGYLEDAKQFFGAYQSSPEGTFSTNLLVDWNNNYWSTAILLASQTDLEAYHYQAQSYLHDWICSSQVITYTQKGRAWNSNSGDMGVTANTAMMAAIYGKSVATKYPAKSDRYICWAKGQIRYILGDVVKAAVVGFVPSASTAGFAKLKNSGPKQPQDRASSCASPPEVCNFINGLYNPAGNPHVLRGALEEGSTTGFDTWADVRTANESRVGLELNAGYTSALAGMQELTKPSWPQCLQGYGVWSKDAVCG